MLEYLNQYQGRIDRLELVSADSDHVYDVVSVITLTDLTVATQLLGIIRGLGYLHRQRVVHGDLKGVRMVFFSYESAARF